MEARIISTNGNGTTGEVVVQTNIIFTKEEWNELVQARDEIRRAKAAAISEVVAHFINWG
jgi:hypothetical protein